MDDLRRSLQALRRGVDRGADAIVHAQSATDLKLYLEAWAKVSQDMPPNKVESLSEQTLCVLLSYKTGASIAFHCCHLHDGEELLFQAQWKPQLSEN